MKKAFTLIELIFVIVVIGILAAVIIPKTQEDSLQQAALQVQSHIQYTQHLALLDDKYNSQDSNWFKKRWQIIFSKQGNSDDKWAYTIFSDILGDSTGKPNKDEIAINPINHNQRMTGGYNSAAELDIRDDSFVGMDIMNLGKTYGITDIEFTCNQRVAFDYLGKPIKSDLSDNNSSYDGNDLFTEDCNITLKNGTEEATIVVKPYTGYVKVVF